MADIVGSSQQKANVLMSIFKKLVEEVNEEAASNIISPLTITLGDEFQGLTKDPYSAVKIVLLFEEKIIRLNKSLKLRYVVHQGEVGTPVNTERAHGMLGKGLKEAREMLMGLKTSKVRFKISLRNKRLSEQLNLLFAVLQGIVDGWTQTQRKIVRLFLIEPDYRRVAKRLKKNPTTIWRRKKNLMIEEYGYLKKLILDLALT